MTAHTFTLETTSANTQPYSDGIEALARAAKYFHLRVEPAQIRHQAGRGTGQLKSWELCRSAKRAGLRARVTHCDLDQLSGLPLPALVKLNDTGWHVLTVVSEDHIRLENAFTGEQEEASRENFTQNWQGEVLLLAIIQETQKQRSFGLGWFLPSVLRHRRQLRYVIITSLLLQIIALVTPLFFEKITDKVLVSRSLSSLDVLGIGMLALACFEPLWGMLRSWLFSDVAGKVNAELSGRLFQHLMALPVSYFQKRQTGDILSRVREMQHIRQFLTGSALTLVLDLVFVFVFLAVMCLYSFALTGIVLGSLILYFVFWLCAGPVLREQVLRQYEQATENTAFLTEAVNGVETIKTTATEKLFFVRWENRLAAYLRQAFRVRILGIIAGQGITLIQKLTSVLLLWWGVTLVMEGHMTPGELIAFNMFSGHVTQPILRLAQVWQDFQHTLISLRRIGEILDAPTESSSGGLASMPQAEGYVSFQHVHFRYNDESPEVLRNLSLSIKPGEFIGITGASGSGKSTLTRLLQRLYIPQHGQVMVDGMDLAVADPVALRRNMSVVQQDSLLFSGTVAENIRQGCPQATDKEVISAATLAGAHGFIQEMPEGYQTQVGEKGGRLSGGQRQRIALARALITHPRILILDEATSALDYESEAEIMCNMPEICRGRTVISIAHRLSTIKQANRILVLNKGEIIEEGRHDELIASDGEYSNLWKLQTDN